MIRMRRVSKRFGKVLALDDVSLTIGAGERVALIGTNGSGKTTLLRALCGLIRVQGDIWVDARDVATQPVEVLGRVAYMPQIAPPLDAPVRELVRSVCALRQSPVEAVTALAATLGLDLPAVWDARVRDLSGDMKQKLLAALALAARTPVLVCDEPTANLDARARTAFFAEVDARPKESVLIVCSHRLEEVRHFVHRVVEMKDGRVLRDMTVTESTELRSAQ